VYFNVNLKLLTKLINSAFVGERTTWISKSTVQQYKKKIFHGVGFQSEQLPYCDFSFFNSDYVKDSGLLRFYAVQRG